MLYFAMLFGLWALFSAIRMLIKDYQYHEAMAREYPQFVKQFGVKFEWWTHLITIGASLLVLVILAFIALIGD